MPPPASHPRQPPKMGYIRRILAASELGQKAQARPIFKFDRSELQRWSNLRQKWPDRGKRSSPHLGLNAAARGVTAALQITYKRPAGAGKCGNVRGALAAGPGAA